MIVACTGHLEEEFEMKAWLHQMDEILPKPVNIATIRELLSEIIEVEDCEKDDS